MRIPVGPDLSFVGVDGHAVGEVEVGVGEARDAGWMTSTGSATERNSRVPTHVDARRG